MSFASHRQTNKRSASSWHGTATILEALLLLIFLLAAIALMTKTLALSYAKADEGTQLSAAAMAAANTAEAFSADPTNQAISKRTENGLTITCDVTPTQTDAGTMYDATIEVHDDSQSGGEPLYTLTTSKYVSGVR